MEDGGREVKLDAGYRSGKALSTPLHDAAHCPTAKRYFMHGQITACRMRGAKVEARR